MRGFRRGHLPSTWTHPLRLLDVGSYDVNGTYRPVFQEGGPVEYHGLDLQPGPGVDCVAENAYHWPFLQEATFDIVISGQAFEHIEWFWLTVQEMNRVLRPGGLTCIIAPSSGHEHRFPVDCWRFYPDGMRALARSVQWEVLECWTDWNPMPTEDESEKWRDTILVARKPAP